MFQCNKGKKVGEKIFLRAITVEKIFFLFDIGMHKLFKARGELNLASWDFLALLTWLADDHEK